MINAPQTHTILVTALSKRDPVPVGSHLNNLRAEYVIICRKVFEGEPGVFIIPTREVGQKIDKAEKERRVNC
jgi:hypothetical protein